MLVHWVAGEKQTTTNLLIFPLDVQRAKVDGLTPYSLNQIELKVKNAVFESAASEVAEVRTPEGTPGPVGQLEAAPIGEDRMKVTWLPPRWVFE